MKNTEFSQDRRAFRYIDGQNGCTMLQRANGFEEYELAESMKKNGYIDLYAGRESTVVKIPYKDLPGGKVKYVEFQWFEGTGWVYVDNNQEEG